MDSISGEYAVDQAAAGSDWSEPAVSVRGLVKRYGSHEAAAPLAGCQRDETDHSGRRAGK